jgi:PIN domain nuclease of toxin-antitoxin system
MRLLLDTQIFIWVVIDSPRLTPEARSLLAGAEATFVSAASIWEIAIKNRLGRLTADPSEMIAAIDASGFRDLPIGAAHCAAVRDLPMHHKDPFDHLLLAQAIVEPLRLMTADPLLPRYSDLVFRV